MHCDGEGSHLTHVSLARDDLLLVGREFARCLTAPGFFFMSITAEIRFEAPRDELAVLDGYCSATGQDRTAVMRRLLREWSDRKHHEAILICRVAGCNPTTSGQDRKGAD